MNPKVSAALRQRVLDLRHHHTLRETAALTGIPLGTVKTLCTRSGAFRDNRRHRALFCLPPVRPAAQRLPAAFELPPALSVTGDRELDAVLWLRRCIQTGQTALIEKALTAAKRITTPTNVLERRYMDFLLKQDPRNEIGAVFGSIGIGDLERLAADTIERERVRCDAAARFGDALFENTPAEAFCIEALAGLQAGGHLCEFDETEAARAFYSCPELLPNTLSDCLVELEYWHALYTLRRAVDHNASDGLIETHARERFVFGLMAERRARTKTEAVAVFRYLAANGRMDDPKADAILLHLLGGAPG